MKLTPLDIHHKEFRHALRGYAVEEVDEFLDQVADELERLFKENIELSEKLEAADEKVRGYQDMEKTLHNTMVAAQRSAEDIVDKANTEGSTVLRDAEVKAKEIIHAALTQKQKVQAELLRIKQAEEEFRAKFKTTLEDHLRKVAEIPLSADVTALFGETSEGVVGSVEVAPPASPEPEPAVTPEHPEPAPEARVQAKEPPVGVTQPLRLEEPPEAGFVTSVQLGELGAPDLAAEEPRFEEPPEFDPSALGTIGEREADVDIEEID